MVMQTRPRRHRIAAPDGKRALLDEPVLTVEEFADLGGTEGPPPARRQAPAAGPSWGQFVFIQVGLVLAVSLVFGSIAYALIPRATGDQPPAAPAVSAPAAATPAMAMDAAHGPAPAPAPANAPRLPQPRVAPPVGPRGPMTVKVDLETQEVVATMDDGVVYEYWTFNGTVPGPMIRVRQGDTVELTLKNSPTSKMTHNIDLHAVTGPGGGGEATMVQPGEAKTFRFRALNPGVF